jgi:hypothetical protein
MNVPTVEHLQSAIVVLRGRESELLVEIKELIDRNQSLSCRVEQLEAMLSEQRAKG